MSRGAVVAIVVLLLVAVGAGGVLAIAVAQNVEQTARLGVDLGTLIGAWRMVEPMPVVSLMGIAAGTGAALVGLPLWIWGLRHRHAARRAEALGGHAFETG